MTIARRPSPVGELLSLRQAMDRLFEDSFVRPTPWSLASTDGSSLAVDVSMTDDELVVEAPLPGFKVDDVDITVENGRLTIQAETASDDSRGDGDYLVREIRRGAVRRSIALPNGLEADKTTATFDDGVLTLRIPKADEVKPRQIRINPVTNGSATPQRVAETTQPSAEKKAD